MSTETAVRFLETNRRDVAQMAKAITDIYDNVLDVVVVRNAFSPELLASRASSLDRPEAAETWSRPNAVVPSEDIYILGTDTPATPTCKAPTGASLDAYLESASRFSSSAGNVFGPDFEPEREISVILQQLSGGKPVEVAMAPGRRRYVPYTLRMLREGKQISVHHDYHYPLALYQDLKERLDTATLISFFLTLQSPEGGGALIVYGLNSDDPRQPVFPNGRWDLEAIEKQFERVRFELSPGDFILLASGRRFHRVEPVEGKRSRVTLGGFLAYDKGRERVLFWS